MRARVGFVSCIRKCLSDDALLWLGLCLWRRREVDGQMWEEIMSLRSASATTQEDDVCTRARSNARGYNCCCRFSFLVTRILCFSRGNEVSPFLRFAYYSRAGVWPWLNLWLVAVVCCCIFRFARSSIPLDNSMGITVPGIEEGIPQIPTGI